MKDIALGKLVVKKIFESSAAMPFPMVFPDITNEDLATLKTWYWDDALTGDVTTSGLQLSVHSYLLQVNDLNILIDTCNGNDKSRSVPFADNLQTDYLANFAKTGIAPEAIDIVLCTHMHCDHVGWNTRLTNGKWVPTFPNARYIFSRKDYEHFIEQEHEVLHRESFDDSVLPIIKAGLADIVEDDYIVDRQIGEGVWFEPANGHSPGMCIIYAQDGGPKAIFSGDTFHHPIQLVRPDAQFFADHDPVQAASVRMELLAKYADTDAVFFPAHFGENSAGKLVSAEAGTYRFQFLEENK